MRADFETGCSRWPRRHVLAARKVPEQRRQNADTRRQGEVHDRLRNRWPSERACRLQPRRENVEISGRKSAPARTTRAHPRDVPARINARSHRQGLGVRAVVHDQRWSSLSRADGGRRNLRVRTKRGANSNEIDEMRSRSKTNKKE